MKLLRSLLIFGWCLLMAFPLGAKAESKKVFTLAVIPQMRVSETYEKWTPFLKKLSQELGIEITIKPYTSIQQFEVDLLKGVPDFAYMNPYEAVSAKDAQGYVPLVKDSTNLVGILVAHKGGSIRSVKDLNGKEIAFPAPNAFAASLYVRALLTEKEKIHFKPRYVKTHSNVYNTVVVDKAVAAGGGVVKTLMKEPGEIRSQLTIIYETPSTASHPLSAHPRVPDVLRKKMVKAVLDLANDKTNKELFNNILMPEPVPADYQKDYLPLKKLGLMLEKYMEAE
jgi:phosphonate transport system substrate-binding protein